MRSTRAKETFSVKSNVDPARHQPSIFKSQWWVIIIKLFMGLPGKDN